jgi:hypothetical protein
MDSFLEEGFSEDGTGFLVVFQHRRDAEVPWVTSGVMKLYPTKDAANKHIEGVEKHLPLNARLKIFHICQIGEVSD